MGIWIGYSQEGLKIKETDVEFHNIRENPFKIYGLIDLGDRFARLDYDFAKTVSGGVASHSCNSSGGRVRFKTNSPYVAIKIKHSPYNHGSPHIARTNSVGIDMYVKENGVEKYRGTYLPPLDTDDGYEGIKHFPDSTYREITLFLPTGSQLFDMEIGLKQGSEIKEHSPYRTEKPIVFYGSSITNGYAASRPGNMYEGFISRMFDINFKNLGFSGNAMGEKNLAEYIAGLDMTAFVLDYDHNAPDTKHLRNTHEQFFKIIREKNTCLPIVIVSRPDESMSADNLGRKDIILQTYLNARNNGDENVYFVDGSTFFPDDCKYDCTVDGCHPTDLGMYFMAKRIASVLKKVII